MKNFEVYKLWPVELTRGTGARLWDKEGKEYLDMYGGHAVISIGHSHPKYVSAISDQVAKLGFYSNSVTNSLQSEYAARLGEVSGCNDYSLFFTLITVYRVNLYQFSKTVIPRIFVELLTQ